MMKMVGVLEYSMWGFLCLRGFTKYKELCKVSTVNPDIQRQIIEIHKKEMIDFLNAGKYRFFPEVILSVSLNERDNYDEVTHFFDAIRMNQSWGSSKVGGFSISVNYPKAKEAVKIATLSFDEEKIQLHRIDGNHRLSPGDEIKEDFRVPFCLILCRDPKEEDQYSTAIFHNINSKQIPLQMEENTRTIIKHPDVFPDDVLKTDNSFGYQYYLARKAIQQYDLTYFRTIDQYISESKYSFFVDLFKLLRDEHKIEENDSAVEIVKRQLIDIQTALEESSIIATTTNIAVIGALAYYRLTDKNKYRGFLSWIKRNNIGNVKELHISDVINLYDEIYKHVPKRVFLARWYPKETDAEYAGACRRLNAIKEITNELKLELIDMGTKDTGTFDIRSVMYHEIETCDIFVADLTGGRHNVMIEVGYALKHVETNRMVFYFQETDICGSVPFDINHFAYDIIEDSADISSKTKARIERILNQARNGDI